MLFGYWLNIIYVDSKTTPLSKLRNTVNENMKQQPLLSYCYHVRWKLMEGFRSLKGSPAELWLCYFLKFLQSYSYYSFSLICVMFLSHDFHYSDLEAGAIYGFGGGLVTFWGFVAGYLIDTIGVAYALKAGCAITLFSRVWVFRTTNRMSLLFNLWFLLPMGCCLGLPVLATGVRRYTHLKNRSFAFALFHVVMNLAVLASGLVFDLCTLLYLPNKPIAAVPLQQLAVLDSIIASNVTTASKSLIVSDIENVWYLSSYRLILLTGIAANVVSCVVTLGVREIKVECDKIQYLDDEEGNTEQTLNSREVITLLNDETEATARTSQQNSQKVVSFTPTKAKGLQLLCETLRSSNFWRLLVVCFATVSVRMIFRHMDATLPKYLEREFGDKTLKGTIYAINPLVVMVVTPIVSAFTREIDPLLMIHYGCYISVMSVFILAMSTSIPACIMFIILLSVGEATWSPRLYDFTMLISQEGREGTYMALASSPVFLAKLPAGLLSGFLLQTFCPETGLRRSKTMWLIIGLSSAISPMIMTVCWKFISSYDRNTSSNISCRNSLLPELNNYNNGKGITSSTDGYNLNNGNKHLYKYVELPPTT